MVKWFLSVLTVAVFVSAAGAADRPAAIMVVVRGEVCVNKAGVGKCVPAVKDMMLYTKDILRTGADSAATFAMRKGEEVRVNENTVVEIRSTGPSDIVVLKSGQLWVRSLHKKSNLDVRTSAGICVIHGTDAKVSYNGKMTVRAYRGPVRVSNPAGQKSLNAGQATTVENAGTAPEDPRTVGADKAGEWHEAAPADIKSSVDKLNAASGTSGKKRIKLTIKGKGQEEQ